MTSRPWMPFYFSDYLADTGHLSTTEHGAYLLLIAHYWAHGGLPDDEAVIARITRMTPRQWSSSRDHLRSLFGDNWCHKRVDYELAQALEKSRTNSANAKRRHSERTAGTLRTHTQLHLERKKEDTADAVLPLDKYEFESGVIRLSKKDFEKWKSAFSSLDLKAELLSLTVWANEQGQKWFFAVSSALAKRNREQKIKLEQAKAAGKGGFRHTLADPLAGII